MTALFRLPLVAVVGLLFLTWANPLLGQDAKEAKAPCTLIIKVAPDAILEVQGERTRMTGAERKFVSPPLDPGKKFQYTLVARWEPNSYSSIARTYKVSVKAGQTINVDMTRPNPDIVDDIRVIFVPTEQEVVDAMCKLAKVGKEDVVYDLGCGDGRIVITAVSKVGAKKGVGVDLDPRRIREAKANARGARVQDRVEFRQGDVFKVEDLEQATVVMLYMSEDVNKQLRPILQARLKPGSRIVSHQFNMGDWKPDRTETIELDGESYEIFLWTIKEKDKKPAEKK